MSRYTEVVLKNVLSGSKNLTGTLKFAGMLSPGHQRVAVHRKSPQKRAEFVILSFIHRVYAYHARNLDLSHILNIKNAGVLPKSASFRGNLVKM